MPDLRRSKVTHASGFGGNVPQASVLICAAGLKRDAEETRWKWAFRMCLLASSESGDLTVKISFMTAECSRSTGFAKLAKRLRIPSVSADTIPAFRQQKSEISRKRNVQNYGLVCATILEYTRAMDESRDNHDPQDLKRRFRRASGSVCLAAGLVLSGPVVAQDPEVPVFDLIYLDEPLIVASLPDANIDLVAQRPTAPTIVINAFHAMPSLPPDAGSRAITQRFNAQESSAPLLPSAPPMDAPIIRLASLTAPNAADIFTLDPNARLVGKDVTDVSPEALMSEVELATALQEELARVGCYRMRVDGQWGPGSRRALSSYLEHSGQSADSQEPDPGLLLMVRASEGEVCPAPVARAPRATQPATTTQPARTAQPTQPAPQPTAPSSPTVSVGVGNVTVQGTISGGRLQGAIRGGLR